MRSAPDTSVGAGTSPRRITDSSPKPSRTIAFTGAKASSSIGRDELRSPRPSSTGAPARCALRLRALAQVGPRVVHEAAGDDHALNLAGALVDVGDAHVAE